MADQNGLLTWRWLGGILMSIVLLGGGTWMTHMATEVGKVKEKVGVIEEQTKRTREDVKEIKETQKDTNRKLDELLRRR